MAHFFKKNNLLKDLNTKVGNDNTFNYLSLLHPYYQACKALLQESNINTAVRKGDIYGFMIEHYVRIQNYRDAYQLVQVRHQL